MKKGSLLNLAEELRKQTSGVVHERVSMKRYTSFRVGGLADLMVFPGDEEDLVKVTAWCLDKEVPWRLIGGGTNLLVRDGMLHEIIINTRSMSQNPQMIQDDQVRAESGIKLAHLIKFCQQQGLAGLEFASGIPGTLGGALYMNAGAHGRTILEFLLEVRGFKPGQSIRSYTKDKLKFEYRKMTSPQGVIWTSALFKMDKDDPREVRERISRFLKARRNSQPLTHPSAGSIFKNPEGDYAGRLIEEVGLKSHRVGDAQVSDKHANFIVNRGRARARDILALIDLTREEVKKTFNIDLELEIEIIGKD